jgi:hypothetical protein
MVPKRRENCHTKYYDSNVLRWFQFVQKQDQRQSGLSQQHQQTNKKNKDFQTQIEVHYRLCNGY